MTFKFLRDSGQLTSPLWASMGGVNRFQPWTRIRASQAGLLDEITLCGDTDLLSTLGGWPQGQSSPAERCFLFYCPFPNPHLINSVSRVGCGLKKAEKDGTR